jgi:hypothetical protein
MRQTLLAAMTALLLADSQSVGAQGVIGREFAAAINDVRRDTKIEGLLFVPEHVTNILGMVVILNYGAMSRDLYFDEDLRQVLGSSNCAVLFARLTNIKPPESDQPIPSQLLRNAAAGGGDALLSMARRLASESGHRELSDVPMLFWGFSAAASFGTTFAAIHPERTLGFVRYHTQRRGLSEDLQHLKQVPALLIAGGKDETAGVGDAESFWKLARSVEAPWAFVVEPDAPHASSEIHANTAKALTIPWIAGVLRHRLSPTGAIRSGRNEQAWLADMQGNVAAYQSYTGDKRTASWLPSEQTARGWQMVAQPAIRPKPVDAISGTWTGTLIVGTIRMPMSIEIKFDGQSTANASIDAGGIVGETNTAKFYAQSGRFIIELDAKPAANPRAPASHWIIEGVAFEGTATGHIQAVNETTALTGHFLITRK